MASLPAARPVERELVVLEAKATDVRRANAAEDKVNVLRDKAALGSSWATTALTAVVQVRGEGDGTKRHTARKSGLLGSGWSCDGAGGWQAGQLSAAESDRGI
jgi:hypothetical protein